MYCGAAEFVCLPGAVKHVPVLVKECMGFLEPEGGGVFADLTFGGGGHSREILSANILNELMAVDCDPDASARAQNLRSDFGDRFEFVDSKFQDFDKYAKSKSFDGILLDLGISSFQLMQAEKGFSFRLDAPVDMRLNPREGMSAAEFLEKASLDSLVRAVREYGEERRWRKVVDAIVKARGTGRLQRTLTAAEVVAEAVGGHRSRQRIHPATKTFQGVRIAINGELEALATVLPKAFRSLKEGGVLCVISFHSLEDRIVKRFMRKKSGRPEHKMDFSYLDERTSYAEMLGSKAVVPQREEILANPKSRSAKLRAMRKLKHQE